MSKITETNYKKLDNKTMIKVFEYFQNSNDFVNVICVNLKFKEITEKLRFNPIPITSLKLFPRIQTQYLYPVKDTKIEGIGNYKIWYEINCYKYLKIKKGNINFHKICFRKK
ncbi:F-box domain-containing protein [Entamoeba marina]